MVQGWAALQGRGREGCANKGIGRGVLQRVEGEENNIRETRQGEKEDEEGKGVFLCLHVIFHGLTQLMLVHTKR